MEICPYTFNISFQVLNITTCYDLLLGRPWIHMAGVVPSTLHQQLKYIINGNLVTILAKPEYPSHLKGDIPMISLDGAIELAKFQAFKVSTAQYRSLGSSTLKSRVPPKVISVAKEMITK